MAVEDEELPLTVCNLLQAIIDALSGEDKREHRGTEEALVLGRRQFSALVQGGGGKEVSVTTSDWVFRACGGGLVIFLHLFSDDKSNRGTAA